MEEEEEEEEAEEEEEKEKEEEKGRAATKLCAGYFSEKVVHDCVQQGSCSSDGHERS